MRKLWSATSLVALTLLCCLAMKEVEAQQWHSLQQQTSRGSPTQVKSVYFDRWNLPQSANAPRTAYVSHEQHTGEIKVPHHQQQHLPQYPVWQDSSNQQHHWQAKVPHWPEQPTFQPPKVPQWPQLPTARPPKGPLPPIQSAKVPSAYQWPPTQSAKVPSAPQAPAVVQPTQSAKVPSAPPQWPPAPATQPQVPQKPATPQRPAPYPPVATQQPGIQSCDVIQGLRVPCGVPGITADACKAISCCFDGQQCYFGQAVTVQCTKDAQFIVIVARDATLPNIDLTSISLLAGGIHCGAVDSNSGFAIYQFGVTDCGTTVTEEPGVITYENRMTSSYEVGVGPNGAITRDSYYELLFQCRYIGSAVETVLVEVLPLQDPPLPVSALGPITVQLRLANGECTTKGCNEVDVAYNSYYADTDYPVTKVLRDPVYVEVQLTQKTDPSLVLTLSHCWTTTSPTPHSMPQWDILINGCPYKDDRYLTTLVPVDSSSGVDFPTHYRRFIFQMFTFVDPSSAAPLKENVYIHCSTYICSASPGISCEPTCARKKRDVEDEDQKNVGPKIVVSAGPVNMNAPTQ